MKRTLVVLSTIAIGLSACGGKSAQHVASNATVQQDEKAAQQIVQKCLPKGNFLTQSGRKAILTCLAPPGHQAALEQCVAKDATQHSIVLHRNQFYQGLAVCVENNR